MNRNRDNRRNMSMKNASWSSPQYGATHGRPDWMQLSQDNNVEVSWIGMYPQLSSIYRWVFPEIFHPAFLGYPHDSGNNHAPNVDLPMVSLCLHLVGVHVQFQDHYPLGKCHVDPCGLKCIDWVVHPFCHPFLRLFRTMSPLLLDQTGVFLVWILAGIIQNLEAVFVLCFRSFFNLRCWNGTWPARS